MPSACAIPWISHQRSGSALPVYLSSFARRGEKISAPPPGIDCRPRSEEHTSELQSLTNLVCRLLLEKKKLGRNLEVGGEDMAGRQAGEGMVCVADGGGGDRGLVIG